MIQKKEVLVKRVREKERGVTMLQCYIAIGGNLDYLYLISQTLKKTSDPLSLVLPER